MFECKEGGGGVNLSIEGGGVIGVVESEEVILVGEEGTIDYTECRLS